MEEVGAISLLTFLIATDYYQFNVNVYSMEL
jgi:hypothetical protein